jgi:hypothetical protein
MKIGMILECQPAGPDASVYPYVAKKICEALEITKPETLVNKQKLMEEAPAVAQTLLASGCDIVFIVWDKKPRWGTGGDCETDKAVLTKALTNIGVGMARIRLCCIDEMMESWMIADCRGFMEWIKSKTTHALPNIGDHSTPALQKDPKNRINRYLRDNYNRWKYNDYDDNLPIVKAFPDFDRAASYNPSFKYFKDSIEAICPK